MVECVIHVRCPRVKNCPTVSVFLVYDNITYTSVTDALGQIVPYRASNVLKKWYKIFYTSDTDALGQIVPYRASNVLKQWYKCFYTSDTDALGQIVPYRASNA